MVLQKCYNLISNNSRTITLKDFLQTLNTFQPITLEEMNEVKLLDRMDVKYTFHINQFAEILEAAKENYKVLIINGNRFGRYETRYFDTPEYEMYRFHHNQKRNRNKVRFRSYLDSGIKFFEVKLKTNKGRTIKTRCKREMDDFSITEKAEQILIAKTKYHPNELKEAIRVYYNRITLVNNNKSERLTLDFSMNYVHNGRTKSFDNLIIAEVKQDRSGASPFLEIMKDRRIKNISLSKYCLGIASLEESVKINNFKFRLNHVNKLCSAPAV